MLDTGVAQAQVRVQDSAQGGGEDSNEGAMQGQGW